MEEEKDKKDELKYQVKKKRKYVKYVDDYKLSKVNQRSVKVYERYLTTNIVKNRDVKDTTYKTYKSYFNIFLVYLLENWDNVYILDKQLLEEDMIDVMESYMAFLQDELGNGKKVINTKIATISAFYFWALKRKTIEAHPFAGRLDRMKGALNEKIIAEYYLSLEDIGKINATLNKVREGAESKYDWIDLMIWRISLDSACRIGALEKLTVSSYNEERGAFIGIREKRGKIVDIPVEPSTQVMIREYLKWRKDKGIDCDALFPSLVGGIWGGMKRQSLSKRVNKIGRIVGVGDFRHHCIRKTRLNLVAKKDIRLAQLLANHESLDTTAMFYTEKKAQSDVLQEIMNLNGE